VRSAFVQEDFTGDYRDGAGLQFLSTTMDTRQNDRAWQNDVAFDLAGTRMEAGHKSRLRNIDSKYAPIGTGHDVVHVFNYEDEVHAAYLSAYRTFGSFVVQAGLRGEAERNSVNSSVGDFKARLFPSVVVHGPMEVVDDMGMRMPSMTRYRLSYGRRINRPEASALNPYTMGEDDMNSFVGNPQLRPEVSDQLEFGVEHHGMLFTWQLTPFLRITQDPIRPLKAVTESGRATTTWHNLTRTRAAGADASVRTRIGMHTTATLSGSLYGMSTEGLSYRNDGVYATVRANVDVRVTERTTVQLYAYRRGAQPIEQGEIEPMTTTELAITQTLGMRERGRVTLRLSDPFESDRVAFRISDPTFVQNSSRYVSRPLASLFLSWSVGGSAGAEAPTRERPPQIF
jgi:outer membrane receptor protein involved in Fe transport